MRYFGGYWVHPLAHFQPLQAISQRFMIKIQLVLVKYLRYRSLLLALPYPYFVDGYGTTGIPEKELLRRGSGLVQRAGLHRMSRGKYLSLEEARKADQLDRFAKEHPSQGDEKAFDRMLNGMASGKLTTASQTSTLDACDD